MLFHCRAASVLLLASVSCYATGGISSNGSDAVASSHRRLSFEPIAGYPPMSLVTDENAIDLDQQEFEFHLSAATNDEFNEARDIYVYGGHSKSVATLKLDPPTTAAIPMGRDVIGRNSDGIEVSGKTYEDYPVGATEIRVQYQVNQIQSNYVGCQVGSSQDPNTARCFAESGSILIDGITSDQPYSYNILTDNNNERSLRYFSTTAQETMFDCPTCPYTDYRKFFEYYGEFDYGDKWVFAALYGEQTDFDNGNADFRLYVNADGGVDGRIEAAKKGSVYLNVFMYIIKEMEQAIDWCNEGCTADNCENNPVHAWDRAVAYYTGSLVGQSGTGQGYLMYSLADKRCANFGTCGDLNDQTRGTAYVNIEIKRRFLSGQREITRGDCRTAQITKNRIVSTMIIPLIQGTLRYAYITSGQQIPDQKSEAEGATFAASILPLIHHCNPDDAATIYGNMRVGQQGSADFEAVKKALENNYDCLGLVCKDIGGLYDPVTQDYYENAEPCVTRESKRSSRNRRDGGPNVGLAAGLSIVGILVVAVVVYYFSNSSPQNEENVETVSLGEGIEVS